ncbi:hypothetical protein, partial [Plesiomonas shigelloides]|uniref:hypothetical protein n=1 Tax=Plesiomonas shigelloides TaxID=703 RepID=UPI001C49BFA5
TECWGFESLRPCQIKKPAAMLAFLLSIEHHSCIPAFLHSCIPAFLHSCIPAFLHNPMSE